MSSLAPFFQTLVDCYLRDDDYATIRDARYSSGRGRLLSILDRYRFDHEWINGGDLFVTWPLNDSQVMQHLLVEFDPAGYLHPEAIDQFKRWSAKCQNNIRQAVVYKSAIKDEQERALVVQLLDEPWLQGWYCVTHEWCITDGRTDLGVGDVVMAHPCGLYLVVEIKWLDHSATGPTAAAARTGKRKEVKEQALRYAAAWAARKDGKPTGLVLAATYINDGPDNHQPKLEFWKPAEPSGFDGAVPHKEAGNIVEWLHHCHLGYGLSGSFITVHRPNRTRENAEQRKRAATVHATAQAGLIEAPVKEANAEGWSAGGIALGIGGAIAAGGLLYAAYQAQQADDDESKRRNDGRRPVPQHRAPAAAAGPQPAEGEGCSMQ